jgi:hypothetical protein
MLRRVTIVGCVLLAVAGLASAQVGWDKHRPTKPLPNPSPVNGTREQIVSNVKALLSRNDIPLKDEGTDGRNGSYVITTEPVVFARGLIAGTQLGHFAETKDPGLQNVVRGRVKLRIEIAPTTAAASKVGVYGTFEGLRAGSTEWVAAPSRGILEDRVMRYLVTALSGGTLEEAEDDLLDTSGSVRP